MLGFNAIHKKSSAICFIFISTILEKIYKVYCYLNGEVLMENEAEDEKGICKIIAQGVNLAQNYPQEIFDDNEKIFQSYIEALRARAKKVIQSAQNEIIAVQKVKTSNQYIEVYNQIKILCLEIEELEKTVKARQNKILLKSQNLLTDFLEIESEKSLLQNVKYEYELLRFQLAEAPQKLNQFIQDQKEVVDKIDFHDQESFNRYLVETKKLKILENQNKYMML